MRVAIQCVPSRAREVKRIKDYIVRCGLYVNHYMDVEHNGTLWNFKRILEDNVGDHNLLVLQDDIIFNECFHYSIHEVEQYMNKNHIGCISLFSPPRNYYKHEYAKGTKYFVEKKYLWQPAILLSQRFIQGLLNFESDTTHDDSFVGEYASHHKDYVQVTIPSLVSHDVRIKSTLGTGAKIGNLIRDTHIFEKVNKGYFYE